MEQLKLRDYERESDWTRGADQLLITGAERLTGQVAVQGSKNSAQKLVPMCALRPGTYRLENLPRIADTFAVLDILEHLGAAVSFNGTDAVIDTRRLSSRPIGRSLTGKSTGTFHFAGALLGRFGEVEIARPGGDKIGGRPVDVHLEVFESFGAEVTESNGIYRVRAVELRGGQEIELPIPSAGVFVNAMLCASMATAPTIIRNFPYDSDIQSAADFLCELGASVAMERRNDEVVAIEIKPISSSGEVDAQFRTPPDRNDAATWLIAASAGGGPIEVSDVPLEDIRPLMRFLEQIGVKIRVNALARTVTLVADKLSTSHLDLRTGPSPGFHSDWGQLALVLLALGDGPSRLTDLMYEGRYTQFEDLVSMGADLSFQTIAVPAGALMFDRSATEVRSIRIDSGRKLRSSTVTGRDVRGAASLVVAASVASGKTTIRGIDQLARGYQCLTERLRGIGVECQVSEGDAHGK